MQAVSPSGMDASKTATNNVHLQDERLMDSSSSCLLCR